MLPPPEPEQPVPVPVPEPQPEPDEQFPLVSLYNGGRKKANHH